MFGWRKRNDGFEWRQYVRTTILVRREQRRQRIENAREEAVNRVRDAAERGAKAGAAGVGKIGGAAKAGLAQAAGAVGSGSKSLFASLKDVAQSCAAGLKRVVGPWLSRAGTAAAQAASWVFGRFDVGSWLVTISLLATFWAGARFATLGGIDREVILAAGIALVSALALASIRWMAADRDRTIAVAALGERLRRVAGTTAGGHPRTAVFAAIVGVCGVLAWWLLPAVGTSGVRVPSLAGASSGPATASGRASAISGDTLKVAGRTLRLDGIEAPEPRQRCLNGAGRSWDCAGAATQALAGKIKSKLVRCEISSAGDGREARGVCTAEGQDIASEMVKSGHVFAESGWFSRYSALETQARETKAGLWRGDAERPAEYRNKRWEEARRAAPDGCPIKGQLVAAERRVYVLPWSPKYERAKVRTTKGERWFCSEAEARAAGWEPSEQS